MFKIINNTLTWFINSHLRLEKIITELKQKEECEISRFIEEKSKKLDEVRQNIELEQVEKEKKHKQVSSLETIFKLAIFKFN